MMEWRQSFLNGKNYWRNNNLNDEGFFARNGKIGIVRCLDQSILQWQYVGRKSAFCVLHILRFCLTDEIKCLWNKQSKKSLTINKTERRHVIMLCIAGGAVKKRSPSVNN